MRWRGITVTGVVIAACLIALSLASNFLVDLVWFSALGYLDVFWTAFGTKFFLFCAVFVGSAVFFWVNGALAVRFATRRGRLVPVPFDQGSEILWRHPETLPDLVRRVSAGLGWRLLVTGVAIVL